MSGLTYEPYRPARPVRVGRPHPQAVTAMVFAVAGLLGVLVPPLLIFSPLAVRTALRAKRSLRRDPEAEYAGAGLAQAALVAGIVGCVVAALLLVALVAVVGLVAWLVTSVL
ncbi:hypothetical protein GCM10022237_13830 [Nocardioides ginsengisoli]|uniref:DUF4190 domain-containing protein n=1 Tax=Nocardioides ginsengisoli TaxID=363868 RepID=A0ABW3W0E5_9ACTN